MPEPALLVIAGAAIGFVAGVGIAVARYGTAHARLEYGIELLDNELMRLQKRSESLLEWWEFGDQPCHYCERRIREKGPLDERDVIDLASDPADVGNLVAHRTCFMAENRRVDELVGGSR